jgi:hypothetical protein
MVTAKTVNLKRIFILLGGSSSLLVQDAKGW